MYTVSELQAIFVEALSKSTFPKEPQHLYDPIHYFLSLGGKRLRPLLVLLSSDLFDAEPHASLPAALAIELFHNFTLMHDDIMDQAPLRRGKQTVHEKWNTNIAILSGDALLIKAYDLLAQSDPARLSELFRTFNKMAFEVCEGQQMDMDFENLMEVDEMQYIEMIRLKTSVLLGAALEIGAILAGADTENRKLMYEFGVNMGIAFQLQDDILDVYGDPYKFGKQVGGDIIENKKTFLLIHALRLAKGEDASIMNDCLTNKLTPQDKVAQVKALYDKLGIRVLAEHAKEAFAAKAFHALTAIAVPDDRKAVLRTFAKDLLIREH